MPEKVFSLIVLLAMSHIAQKKLKINDSSEKKLKRGEISNKPCILFSIHPFYDCDELSL